MNAKIATAKLELYIEGRKEEVLLGRAIYILGRTPLPQSSDEQAIRIPLPGVSREHARILYEYGRYVIIDHASRNGTFIDGAIINHGHKIPLKNQTKIGLGGPSTHIIFLEEETQAAKPQPVKALQMKENIFYINNQALDLTKKELYLLLMLYNEEMRGLEAHITRSTIIEQLWPNQDDLANPANNLEKLISNIRRKLQRYKISGLEIESVRKASVRLRNPYTQEE